MKKKAIAWILAATVMLGVIPVQAQEINFLPDKKGIVLAEAEEGREKMNFNQGWKFVRQNIPEAVNVDYDIAELERWENVDLPHTVRLEEFNNSGGKNYQGPAMYRKHFYLPESYSGKKLYIEFEGVMGVTDVWVNGQHLQGQMAEKTGENTQYGGYLPFVLDISEAVHCDGEANVITVLTDNSDNINVPPGKPQGELDFTYFGGIYRSVWFSSVNTVHITDEVFEDEVAGGGILVDYPEVSKEKATVDVSTHIRNEEKEEKSVVLETEIRDREGEVVASETKKISLKGESASTVKQSITVDNPHLWNLDNPYMHTLVSKVSADGKETDSVETSIGIRKITMDIDTGVAVNGEHTGFLSGVNRHQEYPYIGYAASASLQRRDAIKYKSAGFNIVRTAHHPQSEDFLNACDELGILVVEAISGWQHWSDAPVFAQRVKNDTRQMIRRDRNHPSILTFEISLNESPGVPEGFTNEVEETAKEEHPSARTSAENPHWGAKGDMLYGTPEEVESWSDTALSFIREYGDFWEEQFGGFDNTCRVTRGEGGFYPGGEARMVTQANNRLWKGYNFNGTGAVSLSKAIQNYKDSDHRFAGATMWIGIDHNRGYHETMSPCGIWDLMRIPKYSYYAFASQRPAEHDEYLESKGVETGPLLFVASSWSEKAPVIDKTNNETLGTDEQRAIYVYSNAEKVKLSVMGADGNTLWEQEQSPLDEGTSANLDNPPFYFGEVPYTEGSWLKAEGYDSDGNVIAEQEVHTEKKPVGIRLEADDSGAALTADGSDKVMVYAYIVDEDGNVCPSADNTVQFYAEGEGTIVGDGDKRVGSNPVKAEAGITGAYVEATKTAGTICIEAVADGLESASIEIGSEELKDNIVSYEEIAQGAPIDQVSMYLTEREAFVPGEGAPDIWEGTVYAAGAEHKNSLEVKNMAPVTYDIGGGYERLIGKVGVKNPENTQDGVIFRIYGDGNLKYVSGPVTDETADIDIDISGVDELTLCAGDENGSNEVPPCWLSPYITEGKGTIDESELRENLAVGASATATSTDEEAIPECAVDGDALTLWRSEGEVTKDNKEALTIDLGETCDIRNAKLAVEHDYLKCTYTIYTSADGNEWQEQVTASKTAHGNGEIDYFTAQGVRYIKAEFTEVKSTQGESGGSRPAASVKELEVYKDKGVETVNDYNLKGLSVAGQDILFLPNQTEYEISPVNNESEFWIKAFPANLQSTVTVNGTQVDIGRAESMTETEYIQVTPDDNNMIVVDVQSPDENAVKQYKIYINEENRQNRYDSLKSMVPGINGANGWHYQRMDKSSGEITDLEDSLSGLIAGEYAWGGGSGWLYAGPRYMHPSNDENTVRTFAAPEEGNLTLRATAEKYAGQQGEVALKILKNGEKIWPAGKDEEVIGEGRTLQIQTTNQVEKGDLIQIVLDAWGDNGGDGTLITSCAEYRAESGEENVTYLSDLEWESAEAGYGTVNKDMSSEGQQICLTDEGQKPVVYEKGIGTHAWSRIVYDIAGKGYTHFRSAVGVDYSRNHGSDAGVEFRVYFNDESDTPVYHSGEMKCDTPQKLVDIAIDNSVEKLILVVDDNGYNGNDHADWADARFLTEHTQEDQADVSSLKKAIEMAEKLEANQTETGCYTEESWTFVQEKLDSARALLENPQITQEEADNAFLELITVCNLLENSVGRVGLQAVIEGTEKILSDAASLSQYTRESVEAVRAALAEAKKVYAEESANQETVNAAARSLMDAVTSLLVTDEETRLDILIKKAKEVLTKKDQYTESSVQALETALEAAKAAAGNSGAAQEETDKAYNDLAEALTSLVRKAEKSELKNALDKANQILSSPSDYVADTIANLQTVTDEAQAVYDKEDADTAEVGQAVKLLVDEILKARLIGDVNMDGAVDSTDSAEVLEYAAEHRELTEEQQKAADVNGDGLSDSSDAAGILQFAAEIIAAF